ncbi:general substrate transporter [Aspergillus heterothallicus]
MFSIKSLRGRQQRVLITIICGCAFSLFGYDQALFGGVASGDAFLKQFSNPSASLVGQIAALYDIGCLVGSLVSVLFCHRFGHRNMILGGSLITVIGAIIQTASMNVGMLIGGRIIGGIGNGMNTATVPVYHAETSLSTSRGRAVVGELFVNNVGWLMAQFLTLGFSFTSGGVQWRVPTAFQIVFLVPIFFILPSLPDSPRWLASHERFEEASKVLSQVMEEEPSSPSFAAQMQAIQNLVLLEGSARKSKLSDIWTSQGRNFYRLLLACSVQVMAQIGGINIFAYYVVIIFQTQLGLGSTVSRALAACAGIGLLASNLTSLTVIEKWGRRRLLIIGSLGQCICFLISAIVLATGGEGAKWAGIVVVAMVYLFFIVFAFAWQSIPFLYPAEILSLKYRARFYGLSNGFNWAVNYAIVLITPIGIDGIGWRLYAIFAAFNLVNGFIVYFFFVETARSSLEELDLFFLGSDRTQPIWKMSKASDTCARPAK